MTELGLILGIEIAGLIFALALSRWLSARDAGGAALRRLGAALERATRSFLWLEFRLVAIVAVMLGAFAGTLSGYLAESARRLTPVETGIWTAFGVVLGAALSCVCALFAVGLSLRASIRCATAAESSLDRALCLAVRAGGATGLIGETLSALGVTALFGLLYAIKGGFALDAAQAVPLALEVTTILPGLAVGAALAGLLLQRGGGTYQASSDAGGDHAGEVEAGLDHDDPRNPTSVAELVGDHVGHVAPRTADLFAAATAASVAAIVIGAFAAASTPLPASRPLALLALPLVVRSFGVIASAFGVMVVRTTEGADPSVALFRGHLSATAIFVTGMAGASFWLVREHWVGFFSAGLLGLSAAVAIAYVARFRVERRSGIVREATEGLRAGAGATVAAGLGTGLRSLIVPMVLLGASAGPAWYLGAASAIPSGPALALAIWLMAIVAPGPYALAVGAVGAIGDNAAGTAVQGGNDLDAKRRSARLDEAAFSATAAAQSYLIVGTCLSAVISALALPILARQAASPVPIEPSNPVLVWCGALGASLVLAYAGSVARAGARGAREIALEVERQLRGFPREHGLAQVPVDFTPVYKTCVELSARNALRRALLDVCLVLLVPLALGGLLRFLYRGDESALAVRGLTSFVIMAAITGLCAALTIDGARAALAKVRRENRPRDAATGYGSSVAGDAFADIFGNSAGPAARFVTLSVSATALALAPLLH